MPQIVKSKPLHRTSAGVVHRAVLRNAEHPGFDSSRAQVVGYQHISRTRNSALLLIRGEYPIRGRSVQRFPLPLLEEASEQRSHCDGGLGFLRLETLRRLAVNECTPRVNAAPCPINVLPLKSGAFRPPQSCSGNQEREGTLRLTHIRKNGHRLLRRQNHSLVIGGS